MKTGDLPYISRIVGATIRGSIKEYWNDACPKCGCRQEQRLKSMISGKMCYIYYCSKCATDKRIERYTFDELYDKQLKEL